MHKRSTVLAALMSAALIAGCDRKPAATAGSSASSGGSGTSTQKPNTTTMETPEQLKAGIEAKHPATYYTLAAKLFEAGQKDEAIFWFYLGQLRYRFHLTASKNLDPSGDPALFGALSETVGRPLNEYAFGDIPKLAATIDKVLEWDAAHDNGFTPKSANQAVLVNTRAGLAGLKTSIVRDQEKIKAQRKANGLP